MEASTAQAVAGTYPPGADPDLWLVPTPARILSTAELAECACPEFCERDHDRD